MAYPGTSSAAPNGPNVDFSCLLPCSIALMSNQQQQHSEGNHQSDRVVPAVLRKLDRNGDEDLKKAMWHLLNYEIVEGGDSYPFEQPLDFEQFCNYYCSFDCFVLQATETKNNNNNVIVTKDDEGEEKSTTHRYDFGSTLIGAVHIRPNFPGRSSLVANGAFLVVPHFRRIGAALVLGSFFPVLAKMLGYKTTLFNLVFEENVPSIRLWRKLGYPEVGRVENAAWLLSSKEKPSCLPPPTQEEEEQEAGTTKNVQDENSNCWRHASGSKRAVVLSAVIMFSVQLGDDAKMVVPLSKLVSDQNNRRVVSGDGNVKRSLRLDEVVARSKPFGAFLLEP